MDLQPFIEQAVKLSTSRPRDITIHHTAGVGYFAPIFIGHRRSFVTANDTPGETASFVHTQPDNKKEQELRNYGTAVRIGSLTFNEASTGGDEIILLGTNPHDLKPSHIHVYPFTDECR